MQKDLISIVVPCFHMGRYLKDCFSSLENQTYKNVEIIFVNDGSIDNTLQMLKDFCQDKPNCKIVDQPNLGVSNARNAGLACAQGEYVYFFDPDDFLSPQILSVLHSNLTKHNADISIVRYKRVKENFCLDYSKPQKLSKKLKTFNQQDTISQLYSGALFDVCVWNKLYKHQILKQIENYPNVYNTEIKYGEDAEFNFKYLKNSHKAVFSYSRLYFYRQRKSSLVHSGFNEKKLTDFIGLNYVERECHKNFPEAEDYIKSWKALVCIEMLFYIYLNKYDDKDKIERLFQNLFNCLPFVALGKRNAKWLRLVAPLSYPVFRLFFTKRLSKKHTQTKNKN